MPSLNPFKPKKRRKKGGKKVKKPTGAVRRDFRGTQGVINDASGDVRRRRNQTTDSNN